MNELGDVGPLHHPGIVAVGDGPGETIVDLGASIGVDHVRAAVVRHLGRDLVVLECAGTVFEGVPVNMLLALTDEHARALAIHVLRTLDDHLRYSVCDRKKKLGRTAARRLARTARGDGAQLAPYRCPFCHEWHVGHPPTMATLEHLADWLLRRQ